MVLTQAMPAQLVNANPNDATTLEASTNTILEVLAPFDPMDGHKGTYLMLIIAGVDSASALKLIKRKYRSLLEWRAKDADFKRLQDQIPRIGPRYANQARVLRAAVLDANVIEASNKVVAKYLQGIPMDDGEWALLTKVATIRLPQVFQIQNKGDSSWERLAQILQGHSPTLTTSRELFVAKNVLDDKVVEITAKETVELAGSANKNASLSPDPMRAGRELGLAVVAEILKQRGGNNGGNGSCDPNTGIVTDPAEAAAMAVGDSITETIQ